MAEGVGLLFGNTIAGTFNSINKLTDAFANGVSTLSLVIYYPKISLIM